MGRVVDLHEAFHMAGHRLQGNDAGLHHLGAELASQAQHMVRLAALERDGRRQGVDRDQVEPLGQRRQFMAVGGNLQGRPVPAEIAEGD